MSWEDDAACASIGGEAWFPTTLDHGQAYAAKNVCNNVCPVRAQCLELALTEDIRYGIYGGLDPHGRALIRRAENKANGVPA